ncbi:KRAB-A domain-containing protein 2-like [Arctopsyche grandis]|uniref:KRAB-A domain-containing protein 2-like n=1 Tax=Arctopsyche grandis TaxID=121162 RepID=UPI00406D66C9
MECRLCLCSAPAESLVSIHDDPHPPHLAQRIWTCCHLRIRTGDELPDMICRSCVNNLELLDSFRSTCLRSDKTSRLRSDETLTVKPEEAFLEDLKWEHETGAYFPPIISSSPDDGEKILSKMKEDMKKTFYEILSKTMPIKNNAAMNLKKYNTLIQQVKEARKGDKMKNKHWLLKHYDVLTLGGKEHLISPVVNSTQTLYYIPTEEMFDILFDTHQAIGHGGRDRMRKELQRKYKNIMYHEIQSFLNICEPCLQKRKTEKKGLVVKPMIFSHFNSRCQVDLIDFQSQADGEYKFIMVYQDHFTKFVILRALKSKKVEEVASQLLSIFFLFGAPAVLQFDNGREFCNNIIENLKPIWPGLKIVHGKPQHTQSQGIVERANQDVENMLKAWMLDQHCNNWSKGLDYVQFMKNKAFHSGIKPYEAIFPV